ncbi:MAG: LCP family protein [Oscillospiraceae bacterium]|jgi:hypothetical protein|nr:LCP family protein [Oscillospiraceae bacterium]
MRSKKYDLEFQPVRKRRAGLVLRFLLGFGAIALLLAVISVVVMQKDGLLDQLIGVYFSPTEPTTEADEHAWNYGGSAVFLLSITDDAGQALRFAALVRADMAQRELDIFPLTPNTKAPVEGQEITLVQALKEGGAKQLKLAVEALTDSPVDRYLTAGDDEFVKLINLMGSVTVQVPKRIHYSSASFTLTLAQGSQRLQGDMLLRYFRWLGTQKDNGAGQGELLKRVLESYLVPGNADSPENMERRFNNVMNLIQTDISVTDYYQNKELLMALLLEPNEMTIRVRDGEGEREQ